MAIPRALQRIAVILGVALSATRHGSAQETTFVGFFAGPSTSGVTYGSNGSAHGDRTGFTAGATLRVRTSSRLSLAGNLLYSAKGFSQNEPLLEYSYLEIPFLLSLELGSRSARWQPYLGVGLAWSARLKCRRSFVGVNGPHEDHCEQTLASNLNLVAIRGIDVGREFRLGLRIAAPGGRLVLEGRYARGMIDIEPGHDTRNRFGALTVGYEFQGKRNSPD